MKLFTTAAFTTALACIHLSGCRSYKPLPGIDWQEQLGNKPSSVTITSPADAAALASVGNANLNLMRLRAAGAKDVAVQTGWWEDPELDFDLMRIVNPSDNPFLGGAGFTFTIPVSSANKAAKKAAEAYHLAELSSITAAETEISADAEKSILALAFTAEEKALLEEFDRNGQITQAINNIRALQSTGEYSLSQLNGIMRKIHERKHMLIEMENSRCELEREFKLLAGLKGDVDIKISFKPYKTNSSLPEAPDPIRLASHPAVKAALAKIDLSEAELLSEIRKQYPDLKIGPAFGNEEGSDRIGLLAGARIPAWNRNRQAIAQAQAHRDEAREEAVGTWYEINIKAYQAWAALANLLSHPPSPAQDADGVEEKLSESLLEAGEISPLEYISIREEILIQSLEEIRWRKAVALAEAELKKFNTQDK